MSAINSVNPTSYNPAVATPSPANSSSSTAAPVPLQDAVELSLAGRIALGVNDGKLTNQQGQQLDSELGTLSETAAPQFSQLQSQISQQIYGDTHDGATIPTGLTVTTSESRDFVQAGRVAQQENLGNLTSTQGSQFLNQITQIYQQSQDGTSASATSQAQNQLRLAIYEAAHGDSGTPTS
jgi:hypothetical protein